ncbi:NAD-dependent epimerase/dehydratase family protein [Planococcus sp. APC 4015]|nr:NAD-dependent epimerase/dehydratase family protein [Planococcus sp. APC 4015]
MTTVLILGGTAWLGGRVAARWLDQGASVTCLARGTGPAPRGARLVVADRSRPGAYDAVASGTWDEVVDFSRIPSHVDSALDALGPRAAHWTFVSSVSVYASAAEVGADESAAVVEPAAVGDEYDYARAKSACEAFLHRAVGDRLAILRPGLIVGPGDPTDRFGYWVSRFAVARDEPVLVPATGGRTTQVIDVDDLASFIVTVGRGSWTGVVDTIGASVPLRTSLELARKVAGHTGVVVEASDDALAAAGVRHWAGPRSLPLWLPEGMPGFTTRDNSAYLAAGGVLSPPAHTLARTLADERSRGLGRPRNAGLTRSEEIELLETLS